MVKIKQKGIPTYKRSMVRWIWTPVRLENDLYNTGKFFGKEYYPSLLVNKINVRIYKQWTDIGPSGYLTVELRPDFIMNVGCYRDGWHINLEHLGNRDLYLDINKKIFGDVNKNQMWTQEDEKVVHMMGELYKELKKYLEEK